MQFKLLLNKRLSNQQKIINSILLWLIPVFWALILNVAIKKTKPKVMTKEKRKRKDGSFYESGIGLGGS
jgi:hypothetical protein